MYFIVWNHYLCTYEDQLLFKKGSCTHEFRKFVNNQFLHV